MRPAKQIIRLLGIAIVAALLVVPTAVAASSGIYQACVDGSSMSGYSKADLQSALSGVPSDLDEYYGCSAQINAAIIDKSTANIPGGGKGVKGTRAKLRTASVDDLTTPAERKKALAAAEAETPIDPDDPLGDSVDSAVEPAAGRTLASTTAPGAPTSLVIGLSILALLIATDIFRRFRKSRQAAGQNDSANG